MLGTRYIHDRVRCWLPPLAAAGKSCRRIPDLESLQVPAAEMAFLKELMAVSDAIRRKALIKDACSGDNRVMEGSQPERKRSPLEKQADRLKSKDQLDRCGL